MKKTFFQFVSLVLLILPLLFFQCTGLNVGVMYGMFVNTNPTPEYGNLSASLRGGGVFHKNSTPGQLGNNVGDKLVTGESCSLSVLWLLSWGDSTIESAKENGGIQKVASIEYSNRAIFSFLYHKFCTKVIGSKE
jgi:TRL-like protein family